MVLATRRPNGARNSGATQILEIPTGELYLRPLVVSTPVRLGHTRVDANSAFIVSGSSIIRAADQPVGTLKFSPIPCST